MAKSNKDVTDAELEIMQILWKSPGRTTREIVDQLYEAPSRVNYQTVKKLVARLEAKRFIRRNRSKTAHTFRPIVSHEKLIERRLCDVAESLCEGSTLPLVTCLLQGKILSQKERKHLHDLLNEHLKNDQ